MNVFFEESGDFKAAHVMSLSNDVYQIEFSTGKRAKLKSKDVLFEFKSPEPIELLEQASAIIPDIDLKFLWEVAGDDEFEWKLLAHDYFGENSSAVEHAALILAMHKAPIYFYKKGRGKYKKAPAASLEAALAGIEKKRQLALIQAAWVEQLCAGTLPESWRNQVTQLLFKPEKNSNEFKALTEACNQLQISPQRLLLQVGGITRVQDLHQGKFFLDYFPKGTGFPTLDVPPMPTDLPLADVAAFSIDDVSTTEIDDAFSVKELDSDRLQVGIHIAAPALAIQPGDAIDQIARTRLSTVYMPGDKITMLPDYLVDTYTLGEGKARPALSLYAILDRSSYTLVESYTRIELVPMANNLRHNELDAVVTEENLATQAGDYPHKDEIAHLWQWANQLALGRAQKRAEFGLRPEVNNHVDYNFYVDDDVVSIVRRQRGAPLDKIVAELMIFANSTWGKYLDDHGVPGIYRAQTMVGARGGWGGRLQTKMTTQASPHQGLGVDQYAWSTSPLRRYTDLINQWQIIACVQNGVTAPLVAHFKPKDSALYSIISAFEATYAAYAEFQDTMERYWCLRWLQQHEVRQTIASVMKEDILRLVDIPLVIRLPGLATSPRGTQIRLDVFNIDLVDLSVEARFIERIEGVVELADDDEVEEVNELEDTLDSATDSSQTLEVGTDAMDEESVVADQIDADSKDGEVAPS